MAEEWQDIFGWIFQLIQLLEEIKYANSVV
jgi:hypothetical protein